MKTQSTRNGIYYFSSHIEAENWAIDNGWPIDRIIGYHSGYAIQAGKSGNYAGPRETPRPWEGVN